MVPDNEMETFCFQLVAMQQIVTSSLADPTCFEMDVANDAICKFKVT